MPTLHVVIPFYNEGTTIARCVDRVLSAPLPQGWSVAIILVDDHSDDRHRAAWESLAGRLSSQGSDLSAHRHDVNRGKGAALQTAFDALLNSDPPDDDLVIIQDADLEYDPADYHELMQPILNGQSQVAIGSRWGDHRPLTGTWPKLHAWGNRLLTALSNRMTGYRLRDMECGYKMLTIHMLRKVRPCLTEPRFGIEPQLIAALASLRARVVEVPVSYDPRNIAEGKKIRWVDVVHAIYVIFKERRRATSGATSNAQERQRRGE